MINALLAIVLAILGYIFYTVVAEYILDRIDNPHRFYLRWLFILIPLIVLGVLVYIKIRS